jgi:hypothetical protein
MNPKYFLNYPVPDRIRILLEDKNVDHIYMILNKYTQLSLEDLKIKYQIKLNCVRQIMSISGNRPDIAILFYIMNGKGMTFYSVTDKNLDMNISLFMNTFR